MLLIREIYYNKSMDMQSKLNQRIEYHEFKNSRLKLHVHTQILLVWFILFPVVKCYMWYVLLNVIDYWCLTFFRHHITLNNIKTTCHHPKLKRVLKLKGFLYFFAISLDTRWIIDYGLKYSHFGKWLVTIRFVMMTV